ncbi:hypothetical protein CROQUDRAFT_591729 [Cronartium quercuum f. sp. fusiforme G11]|uniref:Uncharacterized protein n=1 Tax=Cronartium quercuum f. sp. fusiforme G11 TaxID=708437 RepID=A0A9P6NJ20_9BASI|nr:hypothetical protein CROQUDRAFT_591729 [Cronartium quercuum f. sp. fusiforme G11]
MKNEEVDLNPNHNNSSSSITNWAKTHLLNHHHQPNPKIPTWPPQEWFTSKNHINTLRRLPPPLPTSSHQSSYNNQSDDGSNTVFSDAISSHSNQFIQSTSHNISSDHHHHHHHIIKPSDVHDSVPVTESPSNTVSFAPLNQSQLPEQADQDFVQMMESPSNTVSFAPLNQQHSDRITINPINDSSLSTSPPLQTTTSSPQTTLNNEVPKSSPPIPPRSPNLMGNIKKKNHHPPPIHPNLIKEIGVKETLDAQSYRNEEGYKQVNQYILKHVR